MAFLRGYGLPDGHVEDIEVPERHKGVFVIGAPGSGKTSLMKHQLRLDVEDGVPGCVLDVEDTLVPYLNGHGRLLDPTRSAFPFNVLAGDPNVAVEHLIGAFKRAFGLGFQDRAEDIVRMSGLLLADRGLTLADLPRLLSDERWRNQLARQTDLEMPAQFFLNHVKDIGKRQFVYFTESTRNKISKVLTHPLLRPCFACKEGLPLDFNELLVCNLPERVFMDGSSLMAMLIVSQIYQQGLRRPEGSSLYVVHADEISKLASQALADLATRGRKRGIALFAVTQSTNMTPFDKEPGLLDAIIDTSATHVYFQMNRRDAQRFAPELITPTGAHVKLGSPEDPKAFYSVQETIEHTAAELMNQEPGQCFMRIRGKGVFACETYAVEPIPAAPQPRIRGLLPPALHNEPLTTNRARKRNVVAHEVEEYYGDPIDRPVDE